MKIKYLLMVSLTLTILTFGFVSATEDVNASDTLTENIQVEEEIVSQQNEDIQAESVEEPLTEEDDGIIPVFIDIYGGVDIYDGDSSNLMRVYDRDNLNGTVTLVIDDKDVYIKVFNGTQDDDYTFLVRDFKEVPSFGYHKVNVTYQKNGVDKPFNEVRRVSFAYDFGLIIDDYGSYFELECERLVYLMFSLPYGSNGTVNFEFNSKKHSAKVKNGEAPYVLDLKGVKIGTHVLEAQFIDASNKYPVDTIKALIKIVPNVDYPYSLEVNENDQISITVNKDSNVTATLYKIEGNGKHTQVAKVSGKTRVEMPLKKLIVNGDNPFYLVYYVDGVKYDKKFDIDGFTNQKNVKFSFTKTGDKVTINLNGPKTKEEFDVYINGYYIKSVKATNGKLKCVLSDLSIGKHEIGIRHDGGYVFYKTFTVTVKEKDKVSLTLKKVKVKKSAKKLVLKATLKINKKAKKGLKVTFKFNGKKYVAKTDKKGIAKFTIKKKVLKKLKKGKKVTYQATYLKDTVKYTVKVK